MSEFLNDEVKVMLPIKILLDRVPINLTLYLCLILDRFRLFRLIFTL